MRGAVQGLKELNVTSYDYVTLLYQEFLGRNPDPDGLQHYAALLETTGDLRLIVDNLIGSAEFRNKRREIDPCSWYNCGAEIKRPFVIVDVGAQRLPSEEHIYAPLIKAGLDWRCIGFEPLADRRLERIEAEADKRLTMLDTFIGDGKRHIFHLVNDSGSSSLLNLNDEFNSAYEHINTLRSVSEEQVCTRRLDDILRDEAIVDFLKFDIQGFEIRALNNASESLSKTNVIHIETFFAPMYEGQGFFSDIDALLRAAGFEFIDFQTISRYRYVVVPNPSKWGERLIWADAIYFRTLDPAQELTE